MRRVLSVLGAGLIALVSERCWAQAMDYGGLEQMFGEPVTVSATGSPQKAAEAPVNMEIVTADQIRRLGVDNIPDVLRYVTGVDIRRYGASSADIGIRGYNSANSPRVLVLLNGRQLYVDFYGYTAWPTVPVQLAEIRQIEVIKGPNSALYGFNAVNGVINIVTYDPVFDSVNEVSGRWGTPRDQQLSGVGTIHIGDHTGIRMSASEHGIHEFSPSEPVTYFGATPANSYNRSVYVHGRSSLANGIELSAEFDAGDAKQYEMALGGYPSWTAYGTHREKLGIGGESPIGYLNLDAYSNSIGYRYNAGYNCLTCTNIQNTLYVVQASDLMKVGADHSVRLGAEYRRNMVGGTIYSGEKTGADTYAVDAMWNWQISPQVSMTNSARLDHMVMSFQGTVYPGIAYSASQYDGHSFTEPSFNSAVVYKPSGLDTVRLSAARGVQIPSFLDLFPQPVDPAFPVGFPNNKSLQGRPDLKPTSVVNFETDYTRRIPEISSSAQVALFYQISRNILGVPGDTMTIDPNSQYNYSANIGSSKALGGELNLKGADDDGWRWALGYGAEMIADHLTVNQDPGNPNSTMDFHRGTPVSHVIFGLGHTWRSFEFDLNGRWQSRFEEMRVGDNGNTMNRLHIRPSLFTDARIGYEVTDYLRLGLSAQQLNQIRQRMDAGPPVERRVLGTITLHY